MRDWRVPFANFAADEGDIEAVAAAYRSGWVTMGPRVAEFEAAVAEFTGARHAIAVSSGTAALHLLLAALGVGVDDEVVMPALTFVGAANVVLHTGARPRFADIADIRRPWVSADEVRAAIGPRTRALMTMSYGGRPGDLPELVALAEETGIPLIEDAAHAFGSRLDGRHAGTWGTAGALSFFSNKNLAIGEGGMVLTDEDDLASKVTLLRSHGLTRQTWTRHSAGSPHYDVETPGFNYRLDEPRAALGLARLRRVEASNAARAKLVEEYTSMLGESGAVSLIDRQPGGADHLFPILVRNRGSRESLLTELGHRGIQASVHYPSITSLAAYRSADAELLPKTNEYASRTISLPLFPEMSEAQLDLVVDAVLARLRAA